MKLNELRVALDGPSSAGKSTIAKKVAEKAGLVYVDTGALYRTVGLYAARHGIGLHEDARVVEALPAIHIALTFENGQQCIRLCGEEVADADIRTEEASAYSSAVSKIPAVRAYLLDMQKKQAEAGGVIMDGRDIGTVILPEAEVKIFMTATAEERARRRWKQQTEKGISVTFEEVLQAIEARDKQDSERDAAPLRPADDAILFDNSACDVDESAAFILEKMQAYLDRHAQE